MTEHPTHHEKRPDLEWHVTQYGEAGDVARYAFRFEERVDALVAACNELAGEIELIGSPSAATFERFLEAKRAVEARP